MLQERLEDNANLPGEVGFLAAKRGLVGEGDRASSIFRLVEGWAGRCRFLSDGRRQLLSILLPGDFFGTQAMHLGRWDHSVYALTNIEFASIPATLFRQFVRERPGVADSIWTSEAIGASIQREHSVSLGQRSAIERISHICAETFLRLEKAGLTRGDTCDFPLTQADLADLAGLTAVHTNRMLQQLREQGLISLKRRHLTIHDHKRLQTLALWDPLYLRPPAA